MSAVTIYTLGHSNREPGEFLQLLVDAGIRQLVDIRAVPQSRRTPHFNAEILREFVEPLAITYHLAGRPFGGRREGRHDSPHTALDAGLSGYADHMATVEFTKAAHQLVRLAGHQGPLAIMCAERVPERCHRRLLADYLQRLDVEVIHILDAGHTQPHTLSPELRQDKGALIYDRLSTGKLDLR